MRPSLRVLESQSSREMRVLIEITARHWALATLGLAALTGGCVPRPRAESAPPVITGDMAASHPEFACPWVDAERGRAPARLAAAPGSVPAAFMPGCAIIRFSVAADGSPYKAALRAALPLSDGPTALAMLQGMRFQPASQPDARFVMRLSVKLDSARRPVVFTQTRTYTGFFGDGGWKVF